MNLIERDRVLPIRETQIDKFLTIDRDRVDHYYNVVRYLITRHKMHPLTFNNGWARNEAPSWIVMDSTDAGWRIGAIYLEPFDCARSGAPRRCQTSILVPKTLLENWYRSRVFRIVVFRRPSISAMPERFCGTPRCFSLSRLPPHPSCPGLLPNQNRETSSSHPQDGRPGIRYCMIAAAKNSPRNASISLPALKHAFGSSSSRLDNGRSREAGGK